MNTQIKLPEPKLGNVTAITISTPDLDDSLKFYQLLGFNEVMRMDFPFPWIQVSDGALLIMLRKDTAQYAALTYYVNDIDELVSELEAIGISFSVKPTPQEMVKRYVITAPGGMKVSLVGVAMGFTQPPGPTMLKMPQQDYMNPEKYVNKVCGMFGEYACPVDDLTSAIEFWKKLGFVAVSKFDSPYPWAIISDGLAVVGLHQTKHFTTPALTYFAADMNEKIEKLKANGLRNFSEMGGPANIVITTPENQKIFLFKMGM